MTRVESFNKLSPMLDSLNKMISGVIKAGEIEGEDLNIVIEIMKARALIECAGSLAIIADSVGLSSNGDGLVEAFSKALFT